MVDTTAPAASIAEVVRRSHGPSGSNIEYVMELERALAALGISDPHVTEIASLLDSPGEGAAPAGAHLAPLALDGPAGTAAG